MVFNWAATKPPNLLAHPLPSPSSEKQTPPIHPNHPNHPQAAVLVIAAMQPSRQIELLSQQRLTTSALSAKGRSIGAELAGWGGCAGAAVVLLSWAAFAKLVASESGGIDEPSHEEHLAVAMQSGGFEAFSALLSLPGLGPTTHPGLLCRRLLLQALCLVNSAFDLDPMRLEGGMLHQLVDAVCCILEGAWLFRDPSWFVGWGCGVLVCGLILC